MELKINECVPTIGLNMIVKNEAHIIRDTLEKLTKKINFSYWCISDTGSTDGTQEIIQNFFKEKNIPGELVSHAWQDFAYNRTKALESAYNKTDYLLIFDADDEICGNFKLPEKMIADGYRFNFGDENGVSYIRVLMVNNRKKWCYKAVLHEYIEPLDPICKYETIIGDYYVISGRKGARSMDPEKYLKDAHVLEKAHAKALAEGDDLYIRYAFYCANSYKDCNKLEEAIKWYKITLSQPNWIQEKYVSCLRIYECYDRLNQKENGIFYLVESWKYDKLRVECIFNLVCYYSVQNMHDMCYLYYSLIKTWFENEYLKLKDFQSFLFLTTSVYNFFLPYFMIIVYAKLNKREEGLVLFDIITTKKYVECSEFFINNLLHNLNCYAETIISINWTNEKKITFLSKILNYIELFKEKNSSAIIQETHIQNVANLIQQFRPMLTSIKSPFPKLKSSTKNVEVFLSITTCKRLDLFKQTINSILHTWLDIDNVNYFYCVDDNSSKKDREYMKANYPFFEFYLKNSSEKGHRSSMNIIWSKLKELKPKYWIHLEDDWLFFKEDNYVTKSINILERVKTQNVKQILFNRNYAELYSGWNINGGKLIAPGILEHIKTDDIKGINCAYWPHYSFRPSMVLVETILELGNYNTVNNFFERDYADKYFAKGYKSAFYNGICSLHIGKLTSDKSGTNAYTLNQLEQFNSGNVEKQQTVIEKPKKKVKFDNDDIEIKIINLKKRIDRKSKMITLLNSYNLKNYEFVEAIDGSTLELTHDIYKLFKGNDFGNRKGFIGCALSHYNLWKELVNSSEDYYIIFEDDISSVSDNIDIKIRDIVKSINENKSLEIVFLGYSATFPFYKTEKVENNEMCMIKLDKNKYIGGFFAYIITREGANKMLKYIEKNGIKHGIDYLIKINPEINCFNIQPHIISSQIVYYKKEYDDTDNKDSDIQNTIESFNFYNVNNKENWSFYSKLDSCGNDIKFVGKKTLEEYMEEAYFNKDCVAFNTLGFMKNTVNKLEPSGYFKDKDGLYVKKSYESKDEKSEKNVNLDSEKITTVINVKEVVEKKYIRVKMMCNWCSGRQLCLEWNKMTQGNFIWNNIQFTWENDNIDYYIIINKPPPNEYYDASKTIVFQMEPWCYLPSQRWGVKTWGEWAEPDESKFLQVRSHKNFYNNGFWQLKSTYSELKNDNNINKYNHNIISTICTSKYFDPGHIKRIDFLKFIEEKNDPFVVFHLYNEDNSFNFKNYKGKARPDIDKEIGIMNYKYYFMCENNEEHNFMTEKIWEPLLCNCLCFYWGCPNLADYINPLAYVQLDMNDFEKSFSIVKDAIQNNLWEQRLPIIYQERQKVLDYYNFCPTVERIISSHTDNIIQTYNNNLLDVIKSKNLKNVCFIHSCHLSGKGTESLDNLLFKINNSGLMDKLDLLIINNIGIEIDSSKYEVSNKIKLINFSENTQLWEMPTLKIMHYFATQQTEKVNILYLHTKGISYNKGSSIYENVQDWINYMMYFLVDKHYECLTMLDTYDTVGVNYSAAPKKHWSGNYWWATSKHISKLDAHHFGIKHDGEWWVNSRNDTKYFEIHNSGKDHYKESYKLNNYEIMVNNDISMQFFVCFHKKIFHEIYEISEEEKNNNITFYGVKERDPVKKNNIIYECELEKYNPSFQKNIYNEGSSIYHVYINELYKKYDYVGFCQYDMIFHKSIFNDIKKQISQNSNTIFYIDFFKWHFLGGQTSIIENYDNVTAGLVSYNKLFKTNYTVNELINNKMIVCNTFLIPNKMFEKMMSWLKDYFIENVNSNMHDTKNNIYFNPGHMIEALTSMFLSLEISQGAQYVKFNLEHNHKYKVI
jgi:GR25 family glycosyltransferase involved in LPS biosynthesis